MSDSEALVPVVSERAEALALIERLFVVFILDCSGSMNNIKSDTIGAYNQHIRDLQAHPKSDQVRFASVQFNSFVQKKEPIVCMKDVHLLTDTSYLCEGGTALYDAIGGTVKEVESVLVNRRHYRPLIIILTDGEENESRLWKWDTLKQLIDAKKAEGWKFLFLGATEGSVQNANASGLGQSTVRWDATSDGSRVAFRTATVTVTSILDPDRI